MAEVEIKSCVKLKRACCKNAKVEAEELLEPRTTMTISDNIHVLWGKKLFLQLNWKQKPEMPVVAKLYCRDGGTSCPGY